MDRSEPSVLGYLLETWRDESEAAAMAQAKNQKLALAMLERLISQGVNSLRGAGQATQALKDILDELGRIENRDRRPEEFRRSNSQNDLTPADADF